MVTKLFFFCSTPGINPHSTWYYVTSQGFHITSHTTYTTCLVHIKLQCSSSINFNCDSHQDSTKLQLKLNNLCLNSLPSSVESFCNIRPFRSRLKILKELLVCRPHWVSDMIHQRATKTSKKYSTWTNHPLMIIALRKQLDTICLILFHHRLSECLCIALQKFYRTDPKYWLDHQWSYEMTTDKTLWITACYNSRCLPIL